MKVSLLPVVMILAISGQAMADVPPPLKPVEILGPDGAKPAQPAKTDSPTTAQPAPAPAPKPEPAKPTAPVVAKPAPAQPQTPPPVSKPAAPPTVVAAPPVAKPVVKPSAPAPKPPPPVYQPQAPTNLGGFYVGDQVATDSHLVGVIAALYPNGNAAVRFAYGTDVWPASRLVKIVTSKSGFEVGQIVNTDSHLRGQITMIFSDGFANVRFSYGSEAWPLSRLSREISSVGGYSVGQDVITDSHIKGRILEIYADRTALVHFSYGNENWPLSRLSTEIDSLGGFQVGQVVVTDSHIRGVINEIYADRTANVRFSYGNENWPLSRLGSIVNAIGGFQVGQSIVTDNHQRGRILEVYADSTALVQFAYGNENWPISRLARELSQVGGISVGDMVVTDSHQRGQVRAVYADRTADVLFAYGNENWPISRLGRALQSMQGLSVGQQVHTDTHQTGVIQAIYSDGTADVSFSYGNENWPIARLNGFYCPASECPR